MSESDSGPGRREVAYRLFAAEYDDADLEHSESDEERAPNYVVTPTGARVNRLFVVGVLTEVESVSEDVLRARVVDPTGAFVCYAGQYQPDEQAFLERAEPPIFVAMTGKARTFQPDDADVTYTSVRPEAINEVDAETRDRWTLQAAQQTVDRVRTAAGALALDQRGDHLRAVLEENGIEEGLAAGIPLAFDHYGTTAAYLASVAEVALDGARLVAGDIDEVEARTLSPDAAADRPMPVTPREFEVPEKLRGQPADEEPAAPDADTETPAAGGEPAADAAATEVSETTPTAESAADAEPATEPDAGESEPADASPVEDEPAAAAAQSETGDADGPTDDGGGDFEPGDFDLDEDEREEIEEEYGTEFQSGTEVDEPGEADIETPEPDVDAGEADEAAEADEATDAGAETPADAAATTTAEAEARTESVVEDEPAAPEEPTAEAAAAAEPADEAAEVEDADDQGEPAAGAGADLDEADLEDADHEDADLEDVAVDAMEDLDDGSGADRAAVVDAVVDRTGAAEDAVEDAIQEALMDGRCYEPDDDTLQAI